MSVVITKHLKCDGEGCAATFYPTDREKALEHIRRDARDQAGWVYSTSRSKDWCPPCAAGERKRK